MNFFVSESTNPRYSRCSVQIFKAQYPNIEYPCCASRYIFSGHVLKRPTRGHGLKRDIHLRVYSFGWNNVFFFLILVAEVMFHLVNDG